jgi:hypothetical protein
LLFCPPVAVNVAVPGPHNVTLFAVGAAGDGFTVTVAVAVDELQLGTEYETVYCVVTLGVTVTEEPVKLPGFQVNVPPGTLAVAVNVAVWPEQMVAPAVVIVGAGFTVTVIGNNGDPQPEPVQVIVQ